MTNNIIPFDFEGQAVRVVMDSDGNPLFHANDLCAVLDYANPRQALQSHVDGDDVQKLDTIDSLGRMQPANYVTESGMYALIFGSTKEQAQRFKRWVTNQVLPTLRKTGQYQMPDHAKEPDYPSAEWTRQVGSSAESLLAASRSFSAMLRTGRQIGLNRPQQLQAANTITFRATGVDILSEFGMDNASQQWQMDTDARRVSDYLQGRPRATTVEIAEAMGWVGEYSRAMEMRIARIMRDLGYRQYRHQNPDGSRFREWVMPMAA